LKGKKMPNCVRCDGEFSEERYDLGYRICLDCGEEIALEEKENKKKRVGIAYNKGSYQLITSPQMVKDLGR